MDGGRTTSGLGMGRLATRRLGPLALAGSIALSGCFEGIRAARASFVCTPEAARSAGEQDARAGSPPRESYGLTCGVAEPALNAIYTEAYTAVPETEREKPGFFGRLLH